MRFQTFIALSTSAMLGLCVCNNALAQETSDYPEYAQYQDAAGGLSALYRGRQATRYQSRYNGHPYWDTQDYQTGNLIFEGRVYSGISMLIDAVQQELLVKPKDAVVPVALQAKDVNSFNLGTTDYIGAASAELGLPDGIYEVLHKGGDVSLYRNIRKTLTSSPNSANGSSIGYNDPDYNYDILTYFAYRRQILLVRKGQDPVTIKSKGALRKVLKDKKKEIKAVTNDMGLGTPATSLDDYCRIVLDTIDK